MSEIPSRDEIDAKLGAAEARTDTKFAELRADLRVITEKLGKLDDVRAGQRSSFWGLAAIIIGVAAIVVAVLALEPSWFGNGFAVRSLVDTQIQSAIHSQPAAARGST